MTNEPNILGRRLRYQQVMDRIEQDIRCGNYLPGYKLPSVIELSQSLGANHITVRKGMKELEGRGVLEIRPRVGVFVADRPRESRKKMIRLALAFRTYMLEVTKNHPSMAAFLAGAHRRCSSLDYNIQSMFYKENRLVEDIGESVLKQEIDGVVICGGGVRDQDYDFFRSRKIHLVDCSALPRPNDYAIKITVNETAGLRQGVEHLRSLGHRRIGFVVWEQASDEGAIHRAFSDLAFDHQLGDPRELMVRIDNPEGVFKWEEVGTFFTIKPQPTAVIVQDEFIADVLLAGCEQRGIRVPDDLSVAALHDLMPYGHRVPLTTASDNRVYSRMSYLACEMLSRLVEGKPVPKRQISLMPRLVGKASTGPVPVGSGRS